MTDTLVERLEAIDPNRYVEGIGSQKWMDACYNMAPHAYKLRDHIKAQASRIAELEGRIEAVRNVIERGYRGCNKNDKCPHDRFGFEDCVACYDEALLEALEDKTLSEEPFLDPGADE